MVDIISKEKAIELIREVVGNNQGCSEIFLYDKYKEMGGTYYVSGRNDDREYNIEDLLNSMVNLKMLVVTVDDKTKNHYYVLDFVKKGVEISLPSIPTKCEKCRFVAETKNCKFALVKTEHCCLLDQLLEVTDEMYNGKKNNFGCPFKK